MPQSPLDASDGLLNLRVTSNGRPLEGTIGLISVHIRRALAGIPTARLVILDGDMPEGTWPVADGDTFAPGAVITIEAGYGERVQTLFAGAVTKLGVRIAGDNRSQLEVECHGRPEAIGLIAGARDEPVLSVTWGIDLLDFHAEWDAQAPRPPAQAGLPPLRGRMSFQGSALVRPGARIEVNGVGVRHSGQVVVTQVEHEVAQGGWTTSVDFGPTPQPQHVGQAAGLLIGIVTSVEDPAGEGRLQVRLPLPDAGASTLWARRVALHACDGFGAISVPAEGDEVVVGFFDQDPTQPVVLGSLCSSRRQRAEASKPKGIEVLQTRSGHRLALDDVRQVVTVTTAALNQVVLDDANQSVQLQDPHGNRVLLHRGGIRLDSRGDLTIAAQGAMALQAAGALTLDAGVDLRLAGLNVACEARVGFSGKGGATAELSAAGQTVVRGAMVMIN